MPQIWVHDRTDTEKRQSLWRSRINADIWLSINSFVLSLKKPSAARALCLYVCDGPWVVHQYLNRCLDFRSFPDAVMSDFVMLAGSALSWYHVINLVIHQGGVGLELTVCIKAFIGNHELLGICDTWYFPVQVSTSTSAFWNYFSPFALFFSLFLIRQWLGKTSGKSFRPF
jgi:hypothetical protein